MAAIVESNENPIDIWRKIPPEEKLELMARAQSRGLGSTLVLLATTGTMAVGLRLPWIFWCAFFCIPFVFQLSSAKAWRDLKPRAMLEYLAARSAARRYAYGTASKDLTLSLLFKGVLQPEFRQDQVEEALEAKIAHTDRTPVWVALFPDTVVMMSERNGGAKLEFAHSLSEKFTIEAEGFDGDSTERSVSLLIEGRRGDKFLWNLTSHYPAALLAFERKARAFLHEQKVQAEKDRLAYNEMFSKYAGSDLND